MLYYTLLGGLIYVGIGMSWFFWLYLGVHKKIKKLNAEEQTPQTALSRIIFRNALRGHIDNLWRIVFSWPFLLMRTLTYMSLSNEDKMYLLQKRLESIIEIEAEENPEARKELEEIEEKLGNSVISNATVSETEDKGA